MIADASAPPRANPVVPVALAGAAIAALALVLAFGGAVVKAPFVASGALVGLMVGLTGVGGGSLMTPLLILVFGVHPASAVGTDLLYASATKSVGTGVHAANRTVDWRLVGRMAAGSIPASVATLLAMHLLHAESGGATRGLSLGLGAVLLVTAASLLLRERLANLSRRLSLELSPAACARWTTTLGAVLGVLITLTSVGAGALGVTLLVFLYPRTPLARIVGSDIVHAVPLTLIAGVGHWWMGNVDVALLLSLLAGSVPGIIVGSLLTPRLPDRALRLALAVVLGLVALKLLF